jgi:hypothetical protein
MQTPAPPNSLEIDRDDFTAALKAAAKVIGAFPGDIGLYLESRKLVIKAPDSIATATAWGTWPVPVFVRAEWVRILRKRLPPGDPVCLKVDGGRLSVNRYSEACSLTEAEYIVTDELSKEEESRLFSEAAALLKPLRVRHEDLLYLIFEKRRPGSLPPRSQDKQLIATLAKAWVLLAPFGVETADLRSLVDEAVRNAWK